MVRRVIAVQDRERHNRPVYACRICKIFVLCDLLGGAFQENTETTESRYFERDALSPLAEEKNTLEQVTVCFDALAAPSWQTLLK